MEKDTRQRDNKSLALIVKIENGRLLGVNSYQKSTQDLCSKNPILPSMKDVNEKL